MPAQRGEPVLAAVALDAGYGELAAVRGLDLEVAPGEIVALLGPNGAGKTTTVLTLAGDLRPLGGEVRVSRCTGAPVAAPAGGDGHVVGARGPRHHPLAHRGGEPASGPRPRRRRRRPVPRARAAASGGAVGLLSGGEQQMLAHRASRLGRGPSVVLADELSLGLAPLVVTRLLLALRQAADDGVAVLVVEQHVRRVLDVADRVVVLRRGRSCSKDPQPSCAPPRTAWRRPTYRPETPDGGGNVNDG